MTFSKFIKGFFDSNNNLIEDESIELLYTIYMILKRINFSNTVNLSYLGLEITHLTKKVESIKSISEFFVFAKLTSLLKLETEIDPSVNHKIETEIRKTYEKLIHPFTESLSLIMDSQKSSSDKLLFSYNNHVKDLLRYSHHEIEWVNVAFNL